MSSKAILPPACIDRIQLYVIYNSCVLPTMRLRRVVQTLRPQRPTCKAVNITYKDKMTKMWVRQRTQIIDIICHVRNMKWSWACHINRLNVNRYTSRATTYVEINLVRMLKPHFEPKPCILWYEHDIWHTLSMTHNKLFQHGTPTRFGLWGLWQPFSKWLTWIFNVQYLGK